MDSGLSLENLFAILNRANAKHRFVIVDACRVAPKAHFVAALSRYSEESNIIFTACDSNQWAPEVPRLKHGLFTYFLLKGLSGNYQGRGAAGPDGTVTVLGLLDYVTRGIEDWHSHLSEELRYPQQITPRVFYNGKYISLLNNQGIDPTVINNEGLPPQTTSTLRHQLVRNLELSPPSERNDGVTPPTSKGGNLHLPLTISLIPWISTAGFQDPNRNITTKLSLNIIAGYHTKLDGIELGGVLNMKGVEARGVQFAGVANIVGGNVDGFQVSGGLNAAGKNVDGFQASSGLNVSGDTLDGFQLAVGGNLVGGDVEGVQVTVGGNLAAHNLRGWQGALGANFVGGNVLRRGLQTAIGPNIAGNLEGTQLSVIGNLTLDRHQKAEISYAGTQISMVNIALGNIGTQVGLLNIAGHVSTAQVGLLNVSGRMSGIPIGLISFVKDNPLHLQLWGSDTEVANLGLRLGSRQVYSLLMVGSYPHGDLGRWSSGFGIGGHIPLRKQLFLNVDFITRGVTYTDESEEEIWSYDEQTALNKLRLAIGWERHKWFSLFGGVSLNFLVSDKRDTSDFGYGFEHVYRSGDTTVRIWPGFFAGVQF